MCSFASEQEKKVGLSEAPKGLQVGGQKPGGFGSLAFAMKNGHFRGHCSWILAGKARKCGRFWVFACVPNPGKQSIWRQCPPSARKQSTKKLPNRPGFTHVQGSPCPRCPLRGLQPSGSYPQATDNLCV